MNIVAIIPDRDNYILPIEPFLKFPLKIIKKPDWESFIELDPKAAIFMGDWTFDNSEFIQKCKKRNIPTILMMDGIIEWKHFFENPKWSMGDNESPYFPVMCDKIFVPGPSTQRFLGFFGNYGKCEVTGFPRFDKYAALSLDQHEQKNNTIGIMSGNTAGYTELQIKQTKEMFKDLYNWSLRNTDVTIKWRLRKGFEKQLDFNIENENTGDLSSFLASVNAVVCQPSTAVYEAMMHNIPVAIADYNIAPNYTHAAWEINSEVQIDSVLKELINPSNIKMALQVSLLEDNISFCGYSSIITGKLINKMIELSDLANTSIIDKYPASLVDDIIKETVPDVEINSTPIYSKFRYKFSEVEILEEELVKAQNKIRDLNLALNRRNLGFWLEKGIRKLTE